MELQQKINILKSLGVYDKFIENYCVYRHKTVNDISIKDCLFHINCCPAQFCFMLAFRWCNSLEGNDFWKNIHQKYVTLSLNLECYNLKMTEYGVARKD